MNFPEVVQLFTKKRVPRRIYGCSDFTIAEFLHGAFLSNGFSDTGRITVSTHYKGLAEDYQDALLCMGISSTLTESVENELYQVVVTDEHLKDFRSIWSAHGMAQHVETGRDVVIASGQQDMILQNDEEIFTLQEDDLWMSGALCLLTVDGVEEIPNDSIPYVYDVTVENQVFAASGLVLHNTISIAKAGVVATLNARTSVLAACNPKYGRFDRFKSIADQIDLPSTLLSRFDLVYIITDKPQEDTDRRIAEHILNIHRRPEEAITQQISLELLEKYVLYAKMNVKPQVTKEAAQNRGDDLVALLTAQFLFSLRHGGHGKSRELSGIVVFALPDVIYEPDEALPVFTQWGRQVRAAQSTVEEDLIFRRFRLRIMFHRLEKIERAAEQQEWKLAVAENIGVRKNEARV